ncbi:MAG: NlpC/P60 family protein [Smithella sp.]|nr:NlpC/P60 family protein [Smithella sp.]
MKRRVLKLSFLFVLILLFSTFSSNALATQYKVKNGDTLYSISKKFGVSVQQIKKENNLHQTKLKKNQVLRIATKKSAKQTVQSVQSKSNPSYYKVKKGDTLAKIARKTGVSLKELMAINHVTQKSLRIGQRLALAKAASSPSKSVRVAQVEENEDPDATEEDNSDNISLTNEGTLIDDSGKLDEPENNGELLGEWNSTDELQLLVKVATGFIGAPYRFGGESLRGIDCSSFVQRIYRIFDVTLPRSAREQAKVGISITRDNLEKGDLVFFHTNRSLGHVGIYIGNNEFVHASSKSKAVRIDSLDTPYYQKRFQRAIRVKELNHSGV